MLTSFSTGCSDGRITSTHQPSSSRSSSTELNTPPSHAPAAHDTSQLRTSFVSPQASPPNAASVDTLRYRRCLLLEPHEGTQLVQFSQASITQATGHFWTSHCSVSESDGQEVDESMMFSTVRDLVRDPGPHVVEQSDHGFHLDTCQVRIFKDLCSDKILECVPSVTMRSPAVRWYVPKSSKLRVR
jgi:hypothetical protein